ncbi:outer membrane protein assembly factor BamD [Acinetobacter nectaris]|uniref:outer membrane protein assembly factor BamD n=1 Tax=Acinetobacter nectaris TaxID=1219382 RepID=UPI001F1CD4A7|nr:outer membrane protein assembly factor BamD [Acinetobacter nectaris]MCF8998789.1 outer membrane protein assembly factor BamD [Acinetobacter nectaris]MCF9027970.1 outer membrane protein assembly factor BamD [Acinetobacter nectaris]
MSLPRYKVTMLALSLGIACTFVGCSSNPSKKEADLGPKMSEETYYSAGQTALDKGQYNEAAKNFQAIDTYFPTGTHVEQAQLDLIYIKFQQKDYPGAISASERFIRSNPDAPEADLAYAYYARGVANMEQNYDGIIRYTSLKQSHRDVSYLKVAYQNFVDFIRRYPSSQYAVDAAERMKFIGQELAEHEMEAARFNIKRQAWVAAVDRGQWVLEHYPETPQIPEALATVAYSYNALGDQATANQYINVLKLNYPNLVKANGTVNLKAARHEGSFLNRATLGILGRGEENSFKGQAQEQITEHARSLTNRLSFGLLDRPDHHEAVKPTVETQPSHSETLKRSWLNRLSFGLIDKSQVVN